MITKEMLISVMSVPNFSWSASWGQPVLLTKLVLKEFFMTVERLAVGLESVPDIGLLVNHLI